MPYRVHHLPRLPLRRLVIACACMVTSWAAAQSSPYYIGASQSFGYESNLLRLSDNAATLANYSKSDTISSTALLAGIDQGIGRQRLRADLALRSNRYAENDRYNNQSYNASVTLDWETINRLSGSLSGGVSRNLASFNRTETGLILEKNQEDTKRLEMSAQLGLVTQYSLLASFGRREVTNTLDAQQLQSRNFTQDTASLGLRWKPSSLLALGVGLRSTQGRYPKFRALTSGGGFQADRFKRNDVDFTADYQASGLSSLSLRLSTGKTEYDLATQRNFSGVTGALNWGWQASGKVRLNTSLSRDTSQDTVTSLTRDTSQNSVSGTTAFTQTLADYSRVSDTLRIAADWEATSKVSVTASVSAGRRELTSTLSTGNGTESLSSYSLGARWAPTRTALLGCSFSHDQIKGSGGLSGTRIKNDGVNCYGQLMLK